MSATAEYKCVHCVHWFRAQEKPQVGAIIFEWVPALF